MILALEVKDMKSMKLGYFATSFLLLAVALLTTGPVVAQAPPPPPHDMMITGPMGGHMGGEFGEGKTVTGAPLSGTLIVTRDTTLADGNKIHNESQTKVYRDAVGRVRREMGVDLATPATGRVKRNIVIIIDPVLGKRYVLNPDNRIAHEMPAHGPGHNKDGGVHVSNMEGPDGTGAVSIATGGPDGPGGPGGPGSVSKEQLGTKAVNGVQAEGVRVTRTIPAETMGNEKPMVVVTERWYSPELQMVVMTVHTDPMMGTVTSKLVNVTQAAPDASLFQVPSDYTVEAVKSGDMMYVPARP